MYFGLFFAFNMTKWKKQGPFQRNKDPIGTLIGKKVPIGTRVPKQGPNWQQCMQCGTHCSMFMFRQVAFNSLMTIVISEPKTLTHAEWKWIDQKDAPR